MLLFTHPVCIRHSAGPGHPESPQRLASVLQALHGMAVGQGDGPQVFFDFDTHGALVLPDLAKPFARGFGFFAWLRLEGTQRPRARLFSFLRSEGEGEGEGDASEVYGFECIVERGAFELLLYRERERERVALGA